MDSLPFVLLLLVALVDAGIGVWFLRQGLAAGASSAQGRPRVMLAGSMMLGGVLIAALAFFLFPPFG